MPKTKQAQAPPDDPAQSERFVKDAAKLIGRDGVKLYERAMQGIARPGTLQTQPSTVTIANKAGTKKPAKQVKKSGSTD